MHGLKLVMITIRRQGRIVQRILKSCSNHVMVATLSTLFNVNHEVSRNPTRLVILLRLVSSLVTHIRLTRRIILNTPVIINSNGLSTLNISMQVPINRSIMPNVRQKGGTRTGNGRRNSKIRGRSLGITLGCHGKSLYVK